ncbi:unnamed protein product [Rangifer tarandus platyrhynchus]|uniref:Uncharacterized protein n=2 Tax=Rangifer tarandus platyrhynchus TaxID=3082113 RepID=A0ABN8XZ89_RANTA|nr:unnamed protein product [Rangifer tarandus platyrhynchus]CAI9713381.1 unnamed protein product [Rangifer tarandus platyrhynchus]
MYLFLSKGQMEFSPLYEEERKEALPLDSPFSGLHCGPKGDRASLRGAASPARTAAQPATESALPPQAGTCPVTAFGGSPDRPRGGTQGHH